MSTDDDFIVVFCTAPDKTIGLQIAQTLIENRLAACVNLSEGLTSIFRWKGEICRESEILLTIKSRKSLFPQLEKSIRELHPYQVPEIIALPLAAGSSDYLKWITDEEIGRAHV